MVVGNGVEEGAFKEEKRLGGRLEGEKELGDMRDTDEYETWTGGKDISHNKSIDAIDCHFVERMKSDWGILSFDYLNVLNCCSFEFHLYCTH